MDLDGDGRISMYEMEYFYEEQMRKLEQLDIEPLPFEDCVCQVQLCGDTRVGNHLTLRTIWFILSQESDHSAITSLLRSCCLPH